MNYLANRAVSKEESIALQLKTKGIIERDNWSLFPVDRGEFKLYEIKNANCQIASMFDSVAKAIEEFIKLTD